MKTPGLCLISVVRGKKMERNILLIYFLFDIFVLFYVFGKVKCWWHVDVKTSGTGP